MKQNDLYLSTRNSLREAWVQYQKLYEVVSKKASRGDLHDLRNAIQRLNAVLQLASQLRPFPKIQKLIQELQEERKGLGPLRNVQVELQLLKPFEKSPLYDFLKKRQKKAEKRALKKLRRYSLKNQKSKIRKLEDELSDPHAVSASEETARRLENVLQSQERHFERLLPMGGRWQAKKLHQLRIAAKQILYQGEVFQKITGEKRFQFEKYERIHQLVGDLQNEVLLLKAVDQFLKKKKHAQDQGAADLRTDLTVEHQQLIEEAEETFRTSPWHH